jgi:hypothetical protein
LVRYEQGLIADDCKKLRQRNGRDALVCKNRWGAQGWLSNFAYLVQFDAEGRSKTRSIFQTEDTVGTCGEDVDGKIINEVRSSSINTFEIIDPDGIGSPRLLITASLGTKVVSQKERDACNRVWREPDPYGSVRRILKVPEKKYEVEFLFDGTRFKPAPGTRDTIKLFPKPTHPFDFVSRPSSLSK